MAQESEAKFYVMHLDALGQRLENLGALVAEPRVHERNLRFDTPGRQLTRGGRVLRLRQDARARLTYKDSDHLEAGALNRRELEFEVSDFDTTQQLLGALGYEIAFIYEKYRTTYKLGNHEIMLDELPYGHFVEIEGSEPTGLESTARQLALAWQAAIAESYSALFDRLRERLSLDFRDLTFENFKDIRASASDLGVTPADQRWRDLKRDLQR